MIVTTFSLSLVLYNFLFLLYLLSHLVLYITSHNSFFMDFCQLLTLAEAPQETMIAALQAPASSNEDAILKFSFRFIKFFNNLK